MDKYEEIRTIGKGGEGTIVLVKHKRSGNTFILKKRLCVNVEEANDGLAEALSLAKFSNHPNIVTFQDIFITPYHITPTFSEDCMYYLCIVMNYCEKGSLLEVLHSLSKEKNSQLVSSFEPQDHLSNKSQNSATSETESTASSNSVSIEGELEFNIDTKKVEVDLKKSFEKTEISSPQIQKHSYRKSSFLGKISSRKSVDNENENEIPSLDIPKIIKSKSENDKNEKSDITFTNSPSFPSSPRNKSPLTEASLLSLSNNNSPSSSPSSPSLLSSPSPSQSPSPSPLSHSTPLIRSLTPHLLKIKSKKSFDDLSGLLGQHLPNYLPYDHYITWMYHLCCALQAIHSQKLIHRDIKPDNIFVTETNMLKMGDFGLATQIYSSELQIDKRKGEKTTGVVGTLLYCAPEVLGREEYDRSADIWSLGCLLYELATLHLLSSNQYIFGEVVLNERERKKKLEKEKSRFSLSPSSIHLENLSIDESHWEPSLLLRDFPSHLVDIGKTIVQMLNADPTSRPTIDQILQLPCFTEVENENASSPYTNVRMATPRIQSMSFNNSLSDNQLFLNGGTVRQLFKSDINDAAFVLSSAFSSDPRYEYAFPNESPDLIRSKLDILFRTVLALNMSVGSNLWGWINETGKLQAVAIFFSPDQKKNIPVCHKIHKKLYMGSKIGVAYSLKLIKTLKTAIREAMKHGLNKANKNWWYLHYCGVLPEVQNKGVMPVVLSPCLKYSDQTHTSCRLTTFSERSLGFFKKMGFEVVGIISPEQSEVGIKTWVMERLSKT